MLTAVVSVAVNVAVNKTTFARWSSSYRYAARNAVSGSRQHSIEFCYLSAFTKDAWWAVDLQRSEQVEAVNITAGDRSGTC